MAKTLPGDHPADDHSAHTPTVSRRGICRGIAVTALPLTASCSALSGFLSGDPGEVTVFNNTGSMITVTTTVTNLAEGDRSPLRHDRYRRVRGN